MRKFAVFTVGALALAEARLALLLEDERNVDPGTPLDLRVAVMEGQPQSARQMAADGRLAGAHGADEKYTGLVEHGSAQDTHAGRIPKRSGRLCRRPLPFPSRRSRLLDGHHKREGRNRIRARRLDLNEYVAGPGRAGRHMSIKNARGGRAAAHGVGVVCRLTVPTAESAAIPTPQYTLTPSRTIFGVMKIISSSLSSLWSVFLKRCPRTGMSPRNGTLVSSSRCVVCRIPPSTTV